MNPISVVGIRRGAAALSLSSYVDVHEDEIGNELAKSGAVLFRGFAPITDREFADIVGRFGGPVLEYGERSSPRREIAERVYSSTEYPADQEIFFHNENSYQVSWPRVLGFLCREPAREGGETPLADCREVLARIGPDHLAPFLEHGWSYMRNFYPGLGLPWQEVFRTSDRAEVDAYCRSHRLRARWIGPAQLRVTSDARPAVRIHRGTGERVWFNHAAFFHCSTLPPEIAEALYDGMDPDDLPSNAFLGNGDAIGEDVVAAVREAYRAAAQPIAWERDDVLLVDNMLMAHGRRPFTGKRRVSVAMAGLVTGDDG